MVRSKAGGPRRVNFKLTVYRQCLLAAHLIGTIKLIGTIRASRTGTVGAGGKNRARTPSGLARDTPEGAPFREPALPL